MNNPQPEEIRNIGIISHIDAGKTTLSERILFYSGEIHKMGEVHEGLAVMDWMPQEQERGITITATATTCRWRNAWINLIDTPGHVDFTIEVERSMRVLDGAVAIFSAVEGVQPQSESVWRQADRYRVPRICFINKMDRVGADYRRTLGEMATRLKARPVAMQLPFGSETDFAGVIDLLQEQLILFGSSQGEQLETREVPEELRQEVRGARMALLEAAADFDETVLAALLNEEDVPPPLVSAAIRRGTISGTIVPVFFGAALRNKGVQPLLDGVVEFLPSPLESPPPMGIAEDGSRHPVPCHLKAPLCALAFKVRAEEGQKLTYLRIYGGTLSSGKELLNTGRHCRERISRLFRMHAHRRERIQEAHAGDIVAVLGLKEALTGDTLCDPAAPTLLEGVLIPEPVVSLAVEARRGEDRERLPTALLRLQWEDPTFRVRDDRDTGQTIVSGMGELHLEILMDRLVREQGIQVTTGTPQVVYRETILRQVELREVVQREMEGKIQKGELVLRMTPLARGAGVQVVLPPQGETALPPLLQGSLMDSLEKGCAAGCCTGYPLTDIQVLVVAAPFEPGTTTEQGLRAAAWQGLMRGVREALDLLEPVMKLEIIIPVEYSGKVLGQLQQKQGQIGSVTIREGEEIIVAEVPLAGLFGYMTELRSATRGRGSFTMEFSRYQSAPPAVRHRFGLP